MIVVCVLPGYHSIVLVGLRPPCQHFRRRTSARRNLPAPIHLSESAHTSRTTLPASAVYILRLEPLISGNCLIQALYNRESSSSNMSTNNIVVVGYDQPPFSRMFLFRPWLTDTRQCGSYWPYHSPIALQEVGQQGHCDREAYAWRL
jgi:hypothetical protein